MREIQQGWPEFDAGTASSVVLGLWVWVWGCIDRWRRAQAVDV